jgi:hypothetical protein
VRRHKETSAPVPHGRRLQLHRQKWNAALADVARVGFSFSEPSLDLCLHVRTRSGVFFAGTGDELFALADTVLNGGKGSRSERFKIRPVLQQLHKHFVAIEVNEVGRGEGLAEFPREDFRVGVADAEGDERADVAEHGLPDGKRELVDVLMREGKAEAILAGFGENGSEGVGGEIVELVDVEKEIAAFVLRLIHAGHGRELELRREERAKQRGFVRAEAAFREVGNEDAFAVHHKRNAHLAPHLAENVAHHGIEQKLPELVLNRRDGLALKARVVALVFLRPKRAHERVAHMAHDSPPVGAIREEAVHAEQGSVRAIEQCGDGIVEDVFESRPPRIAPDAFERANDAAGDKVPLVRCDVGERVESDGEVEVAGVEIDKVIRTTRRDAIEQFFGKVAVGINEPDAVSGGDVLHDEVAQQSRFSRAGFADEVEVMPLVGSRNAEGNFVPPAVPVADVGEMLVHGAVASRHS